MLRSSILKSSRFTAGALTWSSRSQLLAAERSRAGLHGSQRFFADRKVDEVAVPPLPDAITPATPSSTPIIAPESVPSLPPSPPRIQTAPPTSIPSPATPTRTGSATVPVTPTVSPVLPPPPPPPPPAPPAPKRKPRRFRRFLLWLSLLTGLSYAGGVYYSLVSDNFHDFFTEYIPFGEDAVLYFEERAFRKRFPDGTGPTRAYPQVRGENKVTIPSNAGVSSRVAEVTKSTDLGSKGPHVSAVEANEESAQQVEKAKEKAPPAAATPKAPPEPAKKEPSPAAEEAPKPKEPPKEASKDARKEEPQQAVALPATTLIDPINIEGAQEPIVQEVAKILNDIITVVNSDNAANKYSSTMAKAKDDLKRVATDIATLKAQERKNADDKLQETHAEFDEAAKKLVRRLEDEMHEQEVRWREEYESEREKLSQSYQDKLHSEFETAQKGFEQRLKNQLLEQAIQLKRQFASEVQNLVETERGGRLGKLNELSSEVENLEQLTTGWNSIVDANLQTQHLHVAVDAVRSKVEEATVPQPFVNELVALKEIASDDPVIDAAVSSIPPSTYTRGVPTPAQLIDRFRRVAAEVRKASLLPENAGVASHAASLVLSKMLFKKKGLAVGDDVESILTRTETLLEEGNFDEAAREMNGLQGWAKTLSRDWLEEARRVLEVKQALEVISTEARLKSLLVD